MTLTKMPKVGDKVRYIGETEFDLTIGREYVITGINANGNANYSDNVGDLRAVNEGRFRLYELATEATPQPVGYVRISSFRLDSDGSYDVNIETDGAGFASLKRLDAESNAQAERHSIEQQIAQLQRKLEALQ